MEKTQCGNVEASGEWRAYLKALIVNSTVFVPVYNDDQEKSEALNIYSSINMMVAPVDSQLHSDQRAGSIHCFTSTYPEFREWAPQLNEPVRRATRVALLQWQLDIAPQAF